MRKSIKKGIGVIASAVLAFSLMPVGVAHAAGAISMDGDTSDWGHVASQSGSGQGVSSWKAAYDDDTIYLTFTGSVSNEWDMNWSGGANPITISGSGTTETFQAIYNWGDKTVSLKQDGWQERSDIQVSYKNTSSGNNGGTYVVEVAIPRAKYGDSFNIGFANSNVSSSSITNIEGAAPASAAAPSSAEAQSQQAAQTTYGGISMDGDFSDWDAVAKTTPSDSRVKEVASVWDGDYLYIYAKSGDWGSIAWSGVNNNGKFAVKTDLGYTLLLQFMNDGTVQGPEGTTYYVSGDQWEVAIPKSALPNYKKSVDVGFYLGDSIVEDIQNLDGSTNENVTPGQMNLDGSYSEWDQYPHTVIEYDTAGTNAMVADAHAAMYMSDGKIYGHVVTNLSSLTQRAGGEFSYAVMMFNSADPSNDGGNQQQFGWKYYTLDEDGTVHWVDSNNLPAGEHRFYVTTTQAWGNNINDENKNLPQFGEVIMTIGQDGKDDMEFCMDTKEIADYFKVSAGDLRISSVYYTEIGREWVTTAGTSSGPVLGVIISIAVAGAALIYKRKRMDGAVECVKA